MSLGDALVAATALESRRTLVTRNVDDFSEIEGLVVHNPMST
jgi:predicted nucleic acid-binding protein